MWHQVRGGSGSGLTISRDLAPFSRGEAVISLSYSLLHPRRYGSSAHAVEWRVATQPEERSHDQDHMTMTKDHMTTRNDHMTIT